MLSNSSDITVFIQVLYFISRTMESPNIYHIITIHNYTAMNFRRPLHCNLHIFAQNQFGFLVRV